MLLVLWTDRHKSAGPKTLRQFLALYAVTKSWRVTSDDSFYFWLWGIKGGQVHTCLLHSLHSWSKCWTHTFHNKNALKMTYCGWLYFRGYQFSWIDLKKSKMIHSKGSQFLAMIFSFITFTKNYYFVGTRICGLDPPRKPGKLVPHEN